MRFSDASTRRPLAATFSYLLLLHILLLSQAGRADEAGRGKEEFKLENHSGADAATSAQTGVALAAPLPPDSSLLVPRRDGPYIKYGSGNAAILISFVGATSYGVKAACTNPAVAGFQPHICVASLVGALVLDFLTAFLLEGRNSEVFNPHGLHLDMTHGEMRARVIASLGREIDPDSDSDGVYIGGHVLPETGDEVEVYYYEMKDGVVGHRAHYIAAEDRTANPSRRATEKHRSGTMDYSWRYNNQKRFGHTDKNSDDVKAASKSAAYDWYYNHGNVNRMCGGPVTDSGRLLDDVGIWYAGQTGGFGYPYQPGESLAEMQSCAADLTAAGYNTNV
ncbi:unnamed protein product [Sympodiomycopsis kandeliae]